MSSSTMSFNLFSDRAREEKLQEIADKFIGVSPVNLVALNSIIEYVQADIENRKAFSQSLMDPQDPNYLKRGTILRFYIKSKEFRAFVEDESLPHVASWVKQLKEGHCLHFKIQAIDKSEEISVARHFLNAYICAMHKKGKGRKESSPEVINFWVRIGCELGSDDMLIERCNNNVVKLKKSLADTLAIGEFFNDIRRLGNLYGTFGYVYTAILLCDLANHRVNENNDKDEIVFATGAYKIAADYFFRAKILFEDTNNQQNQEILNALTSNKGLKFFVSKNPTVANYIPEEELDGLTPEAVNAKIYQKFDTVFLKKLKAETLQEILLKAPSKMYKPEPPFQLAP